MENYLFAVETARGEVNSPNQQDKSRVWEGSGDSVDEAWKDAQKSLFGDWYVVYAAILDGGKLIDFDF